MQAESQHAQRVGVVVDAESHISDAARQPGG